MKPKQPSPKPANQKPQYSLQRIKGGYAVFQDGKKVTEENVWPLAMSALERLLRRDNEI